MVRGSALAVAAGAASLLAACTTHVREAGAGWSRAPDLSVYASMEMYGAIAREQSILCSGFSPDSVRAHWRRDFGPRAEAVEAALAARHGAEAIERAALAPVRQVPCPGVPDLSWRYEYARMLRLLEVRLGLA